MATWTPDKKPSHKKLKEEGCALAYAIEVPIPRMEEAVQSALVRVQMKARIPGFRQGKAPIEMIKRQYEGAAREDAVDRMLKEAVPEVLDELDLRPVAVPKVGNISFDPGEPLKFELHVEIAPKFDPTGYKGIAVTQKEYSVSDKDVDERLKQLQDSNARLEKSDAETAAKEHYVVLDYELKRDGKTVAGGQGKQELVDMSSDQTVDGLVAGLVGAKPQEERVFEVKVDGKPTTCKATIQEIKKKVLPALDDDFAKDMGLASLKEMRDKIGEIIRKERDEASSREVADQIESALLKANEFQAPPSLTEQQLEHMMERLKMRIVGPKGQLPEKESTELRKKMTPSAENHVRLQIILAEIARKEKIQATDEDLQGELDKSLAKAENDKAKAETRDFFKKSAEDIRAAIRESKVIKMIREAAKIKTVKA